VAHGNRGKNYDSPLSPATRTYLAHFTRFILAGKSDGDPDEETQAARDKAASLDRVLVESGVGREAMCEECHRPFRLPVTRGRPPKCCPACRGLEAVPRRRAA
jgi:hypothetical protein